MARLLLVAAVAVVVAACDSRSDGTGSLSQPTATQLASQAPTASPTSPPPQPWVALDTDYAHDETFCAHRPLTGKIRYVIRANRVTLRFGVGGLPPQSVGGLPPQSVVAVNWINSPARGYVIAFVHSTATGKAQQSTLRIFRGGEVHGQGLQLSTSNGRPLGPDLEPC